MDFMLYFFHSSWPGYLSAFLILFGIYLYRLPYLIQPVHGFRFRSIFACLLIVAGITGIFCGLVLSQDEITADQYSSLTQKANNNPEVTQLIQQYNKHSDRITRLEFFRINRAIATLEANQHKAKLAKGD